MIKFISGNVQKFEEMCEIFSNLRAEDIDIEEVQDPSTSVVCLYKTVLALARLNSPCLVDDAGLSVLRSNGIRDSWSPAALVKLTCDFHFHHGHAVEEISLGFGDPYGRSFVYTAMESGEIIPPVPSDSNWDSCFFVAGKNNIQRKAEGFSTRKKAAEGLLRSMENPPSYAFLFWNVKLPVICTETVRLSDLSYWIYRFKIKESVDLFFNNKDRTIKISPGGLVQLRSVSEDFSDWRCI